MLHMSEFFDHKSFFDLYHKPYAVLVRVSAKTMKAIYSSEVSILWNKKINRLRDKLV